MSSPPRGRKFGSPIQSLEQKSPVRSRRLHRIQEEDLSHSTSGNLEEDKRYSRKRQNYGQESNRTFIENSILTHQHQFLRQLVRESDKFGVEKLHHEISLRDQEIQKLLGDITLLRNHYDRDLQRFTIENESLKKQLILIQHNNYKESANIQDKYDAMAVEDLNFARKVYLDDLRKVTDTLESTKLLLLQKQNELKDLELISQGVSREYNINLQSLISENNVLRNKLLQIGMKKDNEIKKSEINKQLEKSRTNGIMAHCKQNNNYMEKQIQRLGTQLLDKSINIDSKSKTILKLEKNVSDLERKYEEKLNKIQNQKSKEVKQFERLIHQMTKMHKEETSDMLKKQVKLRERISTQNEQDENMKRQLNHINSITAKQLLQIEQLKNNVVQIHEQHSRDMIKVMSSSRIRGRSMKNISEMSSFRDIYRQDSNNQMKLPFNQDDQDILQEVPEQKSYMHYEDHQKVEHRNQQDQHQHDQELQRLVHHYQSRIQSVEQDRQAKMKMLQNEKEQLKNNLAVKQQETLDILQRFTPLLELRMEEQSLEEERKDKIKKHYKADINILEVMLDKYQIAYLKGKK